MGSRLRHSRNIAGSVRFTARRSSDLSTSFGRRGLSFTADPETRTPVGVPTPWSSYHRKPMPRTPIRRGHSPVGGVLFALFVIGMLFAAVAFSAK